MKTPIKPKGTFHRFNVHMFMVPNNSKYSLSFFETCGHYYEFKGIVSNN